MEEKTEKTYLIDDTKGWCPRCEFGELEDGQELCYDCGEGMGPDDWG